MTATLKTAVKTQWSGIEVSKFGPYKEARMLRLLEGIWSEPSIKQRFLSNPKELLAQEVGLQFPVNTEVKAMEEGENTFHFVIPVTPPKEELWYRYEQISNWWGLANMLYYFQYRKYGTQARPFREGLQVQIIGTLWNNADYRSRMLANPRAVLEGDTKLTFPPDLEMKSLENTAEVVYFVLPKHPNDETLFDQDEHLGGWFAAAHTLWWFLMCSRLLTPATQAVVDMVG